MGRAPRRAARAVAGPIGDAPRAHERRCVHRMLDMAGDVRLQAGYARLQTPLPMVAGAFWLPFATFVTIFSDVDVCDRSTGARGLWQGEWTCGRVAT